MSDELTLTPTIFLFLITIPLIILTIIGNTLVILAWILRKSVRLPQNAYYVSLALADLLVGLFVLPLTVAYTYNKGWAFGLPLCQAWLVVLFSLNPITAYHLVAIAADRYRTLTEGVSYVQRRTTRSVVERACIVWILGLWVALILILDWDHMAKDPSGMKDCVTNKSHYWVAHISFSTLILPFYLLCRIYSKVYFEIQNRLNRRRKIPSVTSSRDRPDHFVNDSFAESEDDKNSMSSCGKQHHLAIPVSPFINIQGSTPTPSPKLKQKNKRHSISFRRERRAAKTLAIIIGGFFACWVPWYVFIFYDMIAVNKPSGFISTAMILFGFANSCINPIIYALRNPEFREAFKGICKR